MLRTQVSKRSRREQENLFFLGARPASKVEEPHSPPRCSHSQVGTPTRPSPFQIPPAQESFPFFPFHPHSDRPFSTSGAPSRRDSPFRKVWILVVSRGEVVHCKEVSPRTSAVSLRGATMGRFRFEKVLRWEACVFLVGFRGITARHVSRGGCGVGVLR